MSEGPRHGYQLIQEITDRSGGAWRPSPGSIYPALAALQDEGLIDDEKLEGRRVYSLTEFGRRQVADRAEELSSVFSSFYEESDRPGTSSDREDFAKLLFGVGAAGVQVARTGTPEQVDEARRLLANVRRDLYRLLADESDDPRG